nr:AEC family transporter [Rhabdaerophilum calidifontis]
MIIDSLLSVFLVIAIGWVLRRTLIREDGAWKGFEQLSYYVLVPVLVATTLGGAKLGAVPFERLGLTLLATIAVLAALLLLARPRLLRGLRTGNAGFTSLFQGILRWNAFIALAIAANLYGREGVTLAAVAIAALIPVLNVLCVLVLRRYGAGGGTLWRGLGTNPYILGTIAGLLLNLTGLPLPRALDLALDIVGRCALGAGLILVGAGLRLGDLRRPDPALVAGVLLRLVAAPALGAGFALLFGLSGSAAVIAIVCLGVPTASASYLLARQMGGDAPLMAAIITAQTLASMLTLPLLVALAS